MRITSNIKANIRQTLRDLPDGRQVYDIILDQIPSQEDEITISCEWDVTLREDGIQIADMTER